MDIQTVTDADIQSDPLAVLDLCIEVLDGYIVFFDKREKAIKDINSDWRESPIFVRKYANQLVDAGVVSREYLKPFWSNKADLINAIERKIGINVTNMNAGLVMQDGLPNDQILPNDLNGKSEILEQYGFITEIHGRWKYATENGRYPSFFADSKESAVNSAWPWLLKSKKSELKTKDEKYELSVVDFNARMDQKYGHLSNMEIQKEIDRLDTLNRSLKNAGQREFNGGGRRTAAAVSNEGARHTAEESRNLKLYFQSRSGFDSIGSELDAITDQDIQADPLAVLDLCIGVLEGATDAITPTGRANPVKTAKGTKIGTQFAVVEVEKLITSHDSAGNENPAFPQELQPRDRSRDASRAWVAKVANSLDNDSLGRTSRADSGAPIVGRDGIVESGNGRTMAIRMAYDQGTADEYRQFLIDEADYFGIDPDQVEGMERPVLVRVRTTDIDRRVFTVEANQDDKLALSATERARSDAKRLDDKLLAIFAPGEDGDLNTAANQRFIQGFLKSIGDNEAAQYMTTDGKPTKGLIDRIQAAIFSKAYNDDRLLEMMADQTKTEIKNVISALNSAAPKFIESQAYSRLGTEAVSEQVVDGIEQSLDQRVIDAVIEATNTLLAAKAKNQDITEYVTQGGLFEGIDEGVAALAVFLSQNARNPKRIGIAFKAMAEFVKTDAIDQTNVGLFGDPVPPSMVDVVAAANREIQRIYGDDDDKTIGLFDSYPADGRYDHIHLDDLQMHPYANAAKERQPTAKTPLLVQKNRRGDLYLIAGVKRYEMALDDDLEYLPAVILPVVEGYGDPVIKRVLNTYTGSIDPLALMAAIEDAVIERAGKSLIR
jgi:hypothetical protein